MKRIISLAVSALMLLSLAACGGAASSASSAAPASAPAGSASEAPGSDGQASSAPSASAVQDGESSGRVLVAYFSATGHTETAAQAIAQATGADLFVITPAQPYTAEDLNYSDETSRVSREYADESLRDVALAETVPEGWDSYDTVFIGYPIWWGVAAWPVSSFVAANDFTGKTVIPFCTSASSGLGDSGSLLAQAAGTGNWLEGTRFSSSVSAEDVQAWIGELGL